MAKAHFNGKAASKRSSPGRQGLTDLEVMRRHPSLFGMRAEAVLNRPISRITDRELSPFTPPCLSMWRNKSCPHLPNKRKLHKWLEAGRIKNDLEDIDTIARRIIERQEEEWQHPGTAVVYIRASVAERDHGVNYRILSLYTKERSIFLPGDGHFHPTERNGDQWWPKFEVEAYARGSKARHESTDRKVEAAKRRILELVPSGRTIKTPELTEALEGEGFALATYREALRRLKDEGKLMRSRTDKHHHSWHRKEEFTIRMADVVELLRLLVAEGPVRASQAMRYCRQANFGRNLIYRGLSAAGILSTPFGQPRPDRKKSGSLQVWHLRDQQLTRVADLCVTEAIPRVASRPRPAETPRPFVPNIIQQNILISLNGKAKTADALESELKIDRRRLYYGNDGHGLNELMKEGLVQNRRVVGGYFRPDAPPEKFSKFLQAKPIN